MPTRLLFSILSSFHYTKFQYVRELKLAKQGQVFKNFESRKVLEVEF